MSGRVGSRALQQGEVQPGEQLLQNTLDVWKGPSMIITGDDDPTVPTQVRAALGFCRSSHQIGSVSRSNRFLWPHEKLKLLI